MSILENIYNGGLAVLRRNVPSSASGSMGSDGALARKLGWNDTGTPAQNDEPLDGASTVLGIGRSWSFPLQQWRARDLYRTVYFDEGRGPALVFVHGLGGNATHWEFIAPRLVDRYRVVGLDLVGCGWTRKPDLAYSIALLRDHLLDFLDSRGIGRATLVGHSLGGAVSLAAAVKKPSLVESLVLLCSAGLGPLPPWMRWGANNILSPSVVYPMLILGADFILDNVFVQGPDENRYVRWFHQTSLRDEPGYPNLRDFARVGTYLCRDAVKTDFSDRLPFLQAPALVMMGDHDKLSSLSCVLRKVGGISRVRTVVIPKCGHMPMVEHPEETLFHMRRFLADPPG
jgi:4,5:9,10-diseco-3-hydroxy-5,9,17-trioxoandrosta-1(10),2-diene-4-oate hydrolase